MKLLLSIAPTVFLALYGQLITKWRIRLLAEKLEPGAGAVTRAVHYLSDFYVLSTYAAAVAGSIAWLFVVERQPLAVAFPVYIGTTVLLVAVGGVVLFGETFTPTRVMGMTLIVAGVALLSR